MNYRIEQKCILYLVLPELLFRFVVYVTKEETTGYNVTFLCTLFTYLSLLVLGCISLKPSQYQETIRRNITLKETGDTYR